MLYHSKSIPSQVSTDTDSKDPVEAPGIGGDPGEIVWSDQNGNLPADCFESGTMSVFQRGEAEVDDIHSALGTPPQTPDYIVDFS